MKDKGIDKGLIRYSDTDKRIQRGWSKNFFGFRKMFWEYLNKLHVPFFDPCCEDARENPTIYPLGFSSTLGLVVFDGTSWVAVASFTTTTTTTTAAPTTTTTTIAPTTTTTTLAPSDVRLKENIRPTGGSYTVLPEYEWDWNAEAKRLGLDNFPTKGVLAQEALEVCPELVTIGDDGYYRVNTNLLVKE